MKDYITLSRSLKNKFHVSCIVPAWNEEKNIKRVLSVITTFPLFDEIIVVDDGSTDSTTQVVDKNRTEHLQLIKHEENKGKTAAVITGITKSRGDLIVLIDADLIGLSHQDIAKMMFFVLSKRYDLAILDRAGDRSAIWGWTNCARFFGGERTFWKKDFLEIELPEEGRYLLEIIMNLHYIKHKKKITNVYCKNLDTVHQYEKFGVFRGYYNYWKMSVDIVQKATISGFIQQIYYIEDDKDRFSINIKEKMYHKKEVARKYIKSLIK